ncbi:hypothetical protein D3C76_1644290 [compost metagenome]
MALSAMLSQLLPRVWVELHHVADGPVCADELARYGVRVGFRQQAEAGIAALLGCPVEQWQVHHAVDDDYAARVHCRRVEVPGTNELTTYIETSSK